MKPLQFPSGNSLLNAQSQRRLSSRRPAIALLLGGVCLLPACATTPTTIVYKQNKPQYSQQLEPSVEGVAEYATADASGETWVATGHILYKRENGIMKSVESRTGSKIVLATGGGPYGWLGKTAQYKDPAVELWSLPPGQKLAVLTHSQKGFDSLLLGHQGNLIVTTTPLADPEGIRGPILYTFWNKSGNKLADATLPARASGISDPTGTAILLLSRSEAQAFSSSGTELWRFPGEFRKGAISEHARVALSNPVARSHIDDVHLYVHSVGLRKVIRMPAPVHHLALSSEGDSGAVAIDEGRLFLIDTSTGTKLEVPLGIHGLHYITDIGYVDEKTLAIGVIRGTRQSASGRDTLVFTDASVLAVSTQIEYLFRFDFALEKPITYAPVLDISYGNRRFHARTATRLIEVNLP